MLDLATEAPISAELARHWHEAFSARRTLNALLAASPNNEFMIRRAQGLFLGAVIVLCMYGDDTVRGVSGEFNPLHDGQGQRFLDIQRQITDACEALPLMPDITEFALDPWPQFFRVVEALRAGDDLTAELECRNLVINNDYGPMWWRSRALAYLALDLPHELRV